MSAFERLEQNLDTYPRPPAEPLRLVFENPDLKAPVYTREQSRAALADFDRESCTYLFKNGSVLLKGGEAKLARLVAQRILEIDHYDGHGLELLCESLIALNEFQSAEVACRERTKVRLDSVAYLLQATLAYHRADDTQAQIALEKALSLAEAEADRLFDIYKLSGNVALRRGDLDSAEEFYHRAFRLDPNSDLVLVNLGTLEIQRQAWSAARMRFQDALKINESNEKAWVGLALVNREQGDIELAWGNLERALDQNRVNLTALQLCVTWGLQDGYWQRSASYLETYLSEHIEDADIAYSLSCIYFHMRRLRDADLTLQRVKIFKPEREGLAELEKLIRAGLAAENAS